MFPVFRMSVDPITCLLVHYLGPLIAMYCLLVMHGHSNSPDNPPRVQHTRKPTEDREQNVDQEVGSAATLEKYSKLGGMLAPYSVQIRMQEAG